ncbi:hypothetical protein MAR_031692 [Mya arenaria]|uniref:Uncharacterized protein n=1 Tax=Mya arenaria TaxID=6604 RepID=A0ABY7F4H8_MYAAR|nr:hypothetical protein MAR_031692 [Mya arenaria]
MKVTVVFLIAIVQVSWSFVIPNQECSMTALDSNAINCLSVLGFVGRTSEDTATCRLVSESANCLKKAADKQKTQCSIDDVMSTSRYFMESLVPAIVLDNCTVHEEPDICNDDTRLSAFGFTTCSPYIDILEHVPIDYVCIHIGLLVDCIGTHVNMLGSNCTSDVIGGAIRSTAGQNWLRMYNAALSSSTASVTSSVSSCKNFPNATKDE